MVALDHSGEVPTWDERERAEEIRRARLLARCGRDAYAVFDGRRWRWVARAPWPYCAQLG